MVAQSVNGQSTSHITCQTEPSGFVSVTTKTSTATKSALLAHGWIGVSLGFATPRPT